MPGEIGADRQWQVPKALQVPKGIQAVKTVTVSRCERRLSVVADALFDFDKSNLRPDAEETLMAAAPEMKKIGSKPSRIEGHTNSIGGDAYNMKLSEARATTVRDWMAKRESRAGGDADQGLRQDRPGRAEHHRRRQGRSGGPAEEPPRRSGVRHLQISSGE